VPKYDYKCLQCKSYTELTHGFHDASMKTCPKCGGGMKKVFTPTPTHFKGNGFYKTDK